MGGTDLTAAGALEALDQGRKFVCFALLFAVCDRASRLRFVREGNGWVVAVEVEGAWEPYAPLDADLSVEYFVGVLARRAPLAWLLHLLFGREPLVRLRLGGRAEVLARLEKAEGEVRLRLESNGDAPERAHALLAACVL